MMKKLLYIKDLKEFSKIFEIEEEKRRKKLAKLSFAKKIVILEKMQKDMAYFMLEKPSKVKRVRN